MKKIMYASVAALVCFAGSALAQSNSNTNKNTNKSGDKVEKKEIIIEEKENGKSEKMVIVVDGNSVTINGKPAKDYKGKKHIVIDDDIMINGNIVRVPGNRANTMVRVNRQPQAFLGVVTEKDTKGAKITEVVENSAAAKAGLKEGDIITKVGDATITGTEDLVTTIRKMKPEEAAAITYMRNGKSQKVSATLGKTDNDFAFNFNEDFMREFRIDPPMAMTAPRGRAFRYNDNDMWVFRDDRPKFGMGVEDFADGDGVRVSTIEPESNAAKAGLQTGDIITSVNGNTVKNLDALRDALADAREASTIDMQVQRNGSTQAITIRVPKKIKSADL